MTVTYIKPKDNERKTITDIVNKNVRLYEQVIHRMVTDLVSKNEYVDSLNNNISVVGEEVGGSSRVNEFICNLPMIVGGAVKSSFSDLDRDVTQTLTLTIDQDQLRQNVLMFTSGELLRRSHLKHEYLGFVHSLYEGKGGVAEYKLHWKDEAGEMSCDVEAITPAESYCSWLVSQIADAPKEIDAAINGTTHYLQGRVNK